MTMHITPHPYNKSIGRPNIDFQREEPAKPNIDGSSVLLLASKLVDLSLAYRTN